MGCSSSRESASGPGSYAPSSVPARPTTIPTETSQTAINPSLLATTSSQRQTSSRAFDATLSASNTSSPRTSIYNGQTRPQARTSLTEHYNRPLQTPKPWSSTDRQWTRAQLRREREEFFETRVTGRREVWAAVKSAAECIRNGELLNAQGILSAAAITLPSGRLEEGAFDERGQAYRVPEPILSDPLNVIDADGDTIISPEDLKRKLGDDALETSLSEKVIKAPEDFDKGKEAVDRDAIKVKCRMSDRGGPDVVILLGKTQPVSVLVRRLQDEATFTPGDKVRMAYLGKMLDEKQSLEDQGWRQGHVVQALVTSTL